MKTALFALVALFLAGCQTVEPLAAPVPDLVLAHAQTRTADGQTITFPAGRYVAAFRKDGATFYRSQAVVMMGRIPLNPDSGIAITADGRQAFFTVAHRPRFLDRPLEIIP